MNAKKPIECPYAEECPNAKNLSEKINSVARTEKEDVHHLNELLEQIRLMTLTLQTRSARIDEKLKIVPELLRQKEQSRVQAERDKQKLNDLAEEESSHHEEQRKTNPSAYDIKIARECEERLQRIEEQVQANKRMLQNLLDKK